MIIREEYLKKIIPFIDQPFIKILTGVRRSGKSTIMMMIIDELKKRNIDDQQILHYNFDSLKYDYIKEHKLLYNEIVTHITPGKKTYIFLDEIQEIENWEKTVNSLMIDYDVDIYITGSNSRMMSSEISTYLTGRYISFKVFPLSFKEYITFKRNYQTLSNHYDEFLNYIKTGGFPSTLLRSYENEEIYTIVRDIYNSTIFTDIVQRSQIRKIDQLERIVKYVFSNVGNIFSANSINKYLKSEKRNMDIETVYNYLSKLETAYLIHKCYRYDIKGKEILKTQEKYYLADNSFRYSVLGYDSNSIAAMLENVVYLELCRRGYDVYIGKMDNYEIDFIAEKQNDKLYIQVTQEIQSEETQKREYDRLLSINDNYPKYVLRTDSFAGGNYNGIITMHVADFLLSDKY